MSKASYSLRTYAEFSSAVKAGNQNTVEALLQQHPDLISAKSEGQTPLYHAVCQGRTEVVAVLLAHGANPNDTKNTGVYVLFMAANYGFFKIVELLLSCGADVNCQQPVPMFRGAQPILTAASNGYLDIVNLLLAYGAVPDTRTYYERFTPIWVAAKKGHAEVIEALAIAGADVDVVAYQSGIGLPEWIVAGQDEIAEPLGVTPLWLATKYGHTEAVVALLKAGANPNFVTYHRKTSVLAAAMIYSSIEIIEQLLKHGANPNQAGQQNPDSLLPLCSAAGNGDEAVVALLLQWGACVDETNSCRGVPPIWVAAKNGHAEVIEALAKAGADVDVVAYQAGIGLADWIVEGQDEIAEPLGLTPLCMAVHGKHVKAVAALLKCGANPNFVTYHYQRSILSVAIKHRNIDIVKLLLNFGVNVHSGHEYEENNMKYSVSPLWGVIHQSSEADETLCLELVDLLLEFGADPRYGKINQTEKSHFNLVNYAIELNLFQIVRKLLLAGGGIGQRLSGSSFSDAFDYGDCMLIDVDGMQDVDGAITTIQEYYRYLCDKERSGWLSIHALFSHLVKLSLLILQKELSNEQRETYYDGLCQRFISKLKSIDIDTLRSFVRYFSTVMHRPPGTIQKPLVTLPLYTMKYYKPVMKQYAAWLINALQARTLKWSAALFLISSKWSPIPEAARDDLKQLIGAGEGGCSEDAIDMVAGVEKELKRIIECAQREPELESDLRQDGSRRCVIL